MLLFFVYPKKCDIQFSKSHSKKVKKCWPEYIHTCIHISVRVVLVCHSVSVFDWMMKSHPYEVQVFLYLMCKVLVHLDCLF